MSRDRVGAPVFSSRALLLVSLWILFLDYGFRKVYPLVTWVSLLRLDDTRPSVIRVATSTYFLCTIYRNTYTRVRRVDRTVLDECGDPQWTHNRLRRTGADSTDSWGVDGQGSTWSSSRSLLLLARSTDTVYFLVSRSTLPFPTLLSVGYRYFCVSFTLLSRSLPVRLFVDLKPK